MIPGFQILQGELLANIPEGNVRIMERRDP